jgi:hypothetical protein
MTPEEHQLVVCMLQQQHLAFVALVENLKERRLLAEGDLERSGLTLDPQRKQQEMDGVEKAYRVFAEALGVVVPEFPEDAL